MDPLNIGGEHSIRNVVYCCGPCNIKKGRRRFLDWLELPTSKCKKMASLVYKEKHGHEPEAFVEGCQMERGSWHLAYFGGSETEEELKAKYPVPVVNRPPSNQPIVIKLDVPATLESYLINRK